MSMKREQLVAVEHRQALAGVEDERDARFVEFARVLQHAVAAVRRDDAELHVLRIGDVVQVRMHHRARMERRDLVVVEVGGDEGLRRDSCPALRARGRATAAVRRGARA